MNGTKRPPLDEVVSLLQSTIAAEGITTAPGAAAGNSIIDAGLAGSGANSFLSMLLVVYPGQPRLVDSMDITGFNNGTGEVTFSTAYKGIAAPIPAGVPYKIVTFRFVPAEVAALTALVTALMTDVGDASAATLGSLYAILGNPAAALATRIGNPDAHTLTNIVAKIGDIARSLDLILGARWDGAGDLGTDIAALLAAGIAVSGTVADGAPAITDFDTSLTEVTDNHYNGGLLLFSNGPNAGQYHLIDVYTGAGGNVAFAASDQWTDIPVNGNAFILIPNAGAYLKKIFTVAATINTVQGAMADAATLDDLSDVTTTSTEAKLRRLLLRLSGAGIFSADIQGAARTELDTMLAQLATYFKAAGAAYSATVGGAAQADVEASLTALAAYFNAASAALSVVSQPGVAARTNLNAILTDLADILAGGAGITNFPAAAVPANGVSLAEVIRQIYNDVIALAGAGVLHEQADVAFNVNAALAEANIFDLSVANTRYVVRSLRLKCVDPGAETVTVRLYELVNNVLTLVDTFAITTANFATYHSLMDMFGLEHLAGDNLKVAVIATAAGPYVCTGQYCAATATI